MVRSAGHRNYVELVSQNASQETVTKPARMAVTTVQEALASSIWGPAFCPELYDKKITTGTTGSILCVRSGYKINSFLAIQTLPVFPVVIFSAPA